MGNNIFVKMDKKIFFKDESQPFYYEINQNEFDKLRLDSDGDILIVHEKKYCFCIESSESHESGPINTFQNLML